LATYSYDNFIKVPVPGDKKLEIYDASGNLMYLLEPIDVNFYYKNNNVVIHQLRTNIERQPCRDHTYAILDFDSMTIAQMAETKANDAKNLILTFSEYYTSTEIDIIISGITSTIERITGSTFIDLADTPSSYSGYSGYSIIVNSGETGLEFVNNDYVLTYTNSSSTLVTFGGIESGSIFENESMQDMWDSLLYPDLVSRFLSFNISDVSNLEVGDSVDSGDRTFSWTYQFPTLLEANSLKLQYMNGSYIANNQSIVSPQTHYLSGVTRTTKTYYYWIVKAKKINTPTYIGTIKRINWYWRTWYGSNTSVITSVTNYTELSSFDSYLTDLIAGGGTTYNFDGNGYKYFFIPTTSGYYNTRNGVLVVKTPSSFADNLTKLGVAMAGYSDGFTDGSSGGYYYKNVTIINEFGISTTYRMYRTKYQLGGPISIIVS